MMEPIMGRIITYITEYAATIYRQGGVPVIEEDTLRQLPKRCSEDNKQRWWHNKSVFVHR